MDFKLWPSEIAEIDPGIVSLKYDPCPNYPQTCDPEIYHSNQSFVTFFHFWGFLEKSQKKKLF